jgi:hypothetical protein
MLVFFGFSDPKIISVTEMPPKGGSNGLAVEAAVDHFRESSPLRLELQFKSMVAFQGWISIEAGMERGVNNLLILEC